MQVMRHQGHAQGQLTKAEVAEEDEEEDVHGGHVMVALVLKIGLGFERGNRNNAGEKEEVAVVVDAHKANIVKRIFISENGWDLWVCLLIVSLATAGNACLIPKTKELYIKIYATKRSPRGSDSDDLSAKLLASEK
ncbi:hypothetical protein EJB05_26001, partial [Eragrostis curvula]